MVQPKVALIEPRPSHPHIFGASRLPRLGLVSLATDLRHRGYEASVWCQEWAMPPLFELLTSDLVGISTTTSTAPEAYRLGAFLRRHGMTVVLGGPHVTFLPDEGLDHASFVLRGEADRTFPLLVDALVRHRGDPHRVPGVSFRTDGQTIHNPLEPCPVDLDSLPIPDLAVVRGRWRSRWRSVPTMTSRGCPHACTFCGVTAMFGRRYRFRARELVLEEFKRLRGRKVFIYDDNFAASPARTKELLESLISRRLLPSAWIAQVRADASHDRELLTLMARANCRRVCIGYESVNPGTLSSLGKNQTLEEMRASIRLFHEAGISVYGMFMLGADGDDALTPGRTASFAIGEGLDGAQFMILTPLPGTALFAEMEAKGRLLTRDWSLYDGQHAVIRPLNMGPSELESATARAHAAFYSAASSAGAAVRGQFRVAAQRTAGRLMLTGWLRDRERATAAEARSPVRLRVEVLDRAALRHVAREVRAMLKAGNRNLEIRLTQARLSSEKVLSQFVRFLDRVARLPGIRIRLTGLNAQTEELMLRMLSLAPRVELSVSGTSGNGSNGGSG